MPTLAISAYSYVKEQSSGCMLVCLLPPKIERSISYDFFGGEQSSLPRILGFNRK